MIPIEDQDPTEIIICYAATKSKRLTARLIHISKRKLYLCSQRNNQRVINKQLEIDLRTAHAVLDLPLFATERIGSSSNECEERVKLYPIRILMVPMTRRTLYFIQEADRLSTMALIMKAQGMSCQMEKYNILKYLGRSIMSVVNKYNLKSYTMKVIQRDSSDIEKSDLLPELQL